MHLVVEEPVDFGACRRCTCSALRRVSRAVTHHYDEIMRGTGLRSTQFTILTTLLQTGPLSMTRLAAFLGLDRTTLTRNLKPLTRDGLVEFCAEKDGRVRKVAVTTKGQSAARDAFPLWSRAQNSAAALIAELELPI